MKKYDYYEAALIAIQKVEAIRRYFEEDGISENNIHLQQSEVVYDIANAGVGIIFEEVELVTGEIGYKLMSNYRQSKIGEIRFIGEKGTYIKPAGTQVSKTLNKIFSGLNYIELVSELSEKQQDILT